MASITIRNLDVKARLRIGAAEHGRSMKAEAREILTEGLDRRLPRRHIGDEVRAIGEPPGGIELDIPPREPMKDEDLLVFSGPEYDR